MTVAQADTPPRTRANIPPSQGICQGKAESSPRSPLILPNNDRTRAPSGHAVETRANLERFATNAWGRYSPDG